MGRKRGRPRKRGPREPNGRVSRKGKERPRYTREPPAILDASLLQRGATLDPDGNLVGREEAMRREAGSVMGRLALAGVITPRQYHAAMRYAAAWRRWAALAGIPPHVLTQREQGLKKEPREMAWRTAKRVFFAADAQVRAMGDRIWRFVELLVMDDQEPLAPIGEAGARALRAALDRLAAHYGLAEDMVL